MVAELNALLERGGVLGPLVLVGHSFGAINVRLFARSHPDRIAGIVLLDPAHEDQMRRIPSLRVAAEESVRQFERLEPLATSGLIALAPGNIPNRGLPKQAWEQYAAVVATTGYFHAAAAETAAMPGNLAYAGAMRASLGSVPLIIISRGQPEPTTELSARDAGRLEEEWRAMQDDLLSLSSNSRHIIAVQSGHYVQLDQPKLVAHALAGLIGRISGY
jgi:pimeloyl-ACP methyl ester carboxylesterase